jgi:mono/diheme cytochrome c family protein
LSRLAAVVAFLAGPSLVLARADETAGNPERGRQILDELNPRCTVCHSIAGKGNPKGPLDDVGRRWKTDELKQWLQTPAEMAKKHGKTRKPPMLPYPELADDELADVVAYLASLKNPESAP